MIQHIALPLHPPQLLPQNARRAHLPLAEGADLHAPHEGHLLQFHGFGLVVEGAAVAAEGEDGEAGAVAETPALEVEGVKVSRVFFTKEEGWGAKVRRM